MNADAVYALIPILGVVFGCPTAVLLGVLLFPSTREAFAERLRGRRAGSAGDAALAQPAVEAQLAAVRAEVYALRCELAAVSHAIAPGARAPEALTAGERS